MVDLEQPMEFLKAISNTFPKYYWGNDNSLGVAWIGIKSIAQVRFDCHESGNIHLYLNNQYMLSRSYPMDSYEGQLICELVVQTQKYFNHPKNSSYQNFYSDVLIKQSEQIILHYFPNKSVEKGYIH